MNTTNLGALREMSELLRDRSDGVIKDFDAMNERPGDASGLASYHFIPGCDLEPPPKPPDLRPHDQIKPKEWHEKIARTWDMWRWRFQP